MSPGQLSSRVHSFGVGAPRAAHKRGTFEPDRLQIDHNPRREEQGTRSAPPHHTERATVRPGFVGIPWRSCDDRFEFSGVYIRGCIGVR